MAYKTKVINKAYILIKGKLKIRYSRIKKIIKLIIIKEKLSSFL
jgi:hypothetical protein